ncbi:MAG: hypothetical protein IJM58_10605 [Muribaculaceae bacterium]|nr:hypothetical protein [Muribaculaceae bacterium]
MRWTCPKCGKKLDVSNEQLIANDGVIVCPQCLLQAHQPIPKARITERTAEPEPAPRRKSTETIDFDTPPEYKPSTPPPHKPRMKQASTSYRYTGMSGSNSSSSTPKRKPSSKKKSKKKKNSEGMSAWGCMGRTIIFTLVLFAAYVFFGLLLDALQ